MAGGVLSISVITWTHVAVFPHPSVAVHVRVIVTPRRQFPDEGTSLKSIDGVRLQLSVAVAVPVFTGSGFSSQSIVISGGQTITGAVLSSTVITWTQVVLSPSGYVAVHVRVMTNSCGHAPCETTSANVTVGTIPQLPVAVAVPVFAGNVLSSHSMVTSAGHMMEGGPLGSTITTWSHVLMHPFASVTVTEYVPARLTVIQLVVSAVFHK
jgi:hypothetical protein